MSYKDDINFVAALPLIFKHEGGYNNDVDDSGGATNWGISLQFLKSLPLKVADINGDGVVDWRDIKNLSKEDASKLYYDYFWLKSGANRIIDSALATKYFDMAINMGNSQAAKLLQKAFNTLLGNKLLTTDGVLGKASLVAINECHDKPKLFEAFKDECRAFYHHLVEIKPVNEKYINGWLNRVNDMGAH